MRFGHKASPIYGESRGVVEFGVAPSGLPSGSRRCWKMVSWGTTIQSFEALNISFGILSNIPALWKNVAGIPHTNLRASVRLRKVLENGFLIPDVFKNKVLSLANILSVSLKMRLLKNKRVMRYACHYLNSLVNLRTFHLFIRQWMCLEYRESDIDVSIKTDKLGNYFHPQ